MTYNPVTPEIAGKLKEICGPKNVLASDEEREPYSHDETACLSAVPAVVVRPENTAQVSAVMKLAFENRIPVTPRGAGTGLSGGAVPVMGGILLSLERLNKILSVDPENLMVVAQADAITGDIQKAVEEKGLFYPPDPASLDSCSIGGNVAENAGGPRALKYGVTRHYLCGLEVVWPDGRISRMGGKLMKNVAGYDLPGLVCGSEGTLCVITEVTLSLIPRPPHEVDLLIPFNSIADAVAATTKLISARILPATMEFMERKAISASEKMLEKTAPFPNASAHLLIQLDGTDKAQLQSDYEKIGEIAMEYGAEDILVAEDKASQDRIWEIRRAISEAITHKSPVLKKDDIVVPRAKLPELFDRLAALEGKYGIEIISFGHIGDGNVHINFLKNNVSQEDWDQKIGPLMRETFEMTVSLGGAITGEHGVGCTKRQHLPLSVDEPSLELMRKIKSACDPRGILNPGKVFPDECPAACREQAETAAAV
ncbi:MAG: FAD-linked oxidase C-terminal domain-containing protein [Elusimicrobiales bacterium]